MGLDRFANFISKSINNDGIEEININNNYRKIISNHIVFDLTFLIYQELINIENEINDIIKITSGSTKKISDFVNNLYKEIINTDEKL